MSYVPVDSDERAEEGLQFKSFLNTPNNNEERGYFADNTKPAGFWTIEYYRPYFDIDTTTVLRRCYSTLIVTQANNYLGNHLNPADLYGPFWTLTTLIFSLFLSSSLAASIATYLSQPGSEAFDYDFRLLSIAVSLVYSYGIVLPVLLWLALRYLGVGEWSIIEAVAIWGYGQFVWIPVSLLCIVPIAILRWVLVGLAFGLSGYFLVANVYPILATAEAKATRLIIIIVALLHAALALSFKILFFGYYIAEVGPKDPAGGQTVTL